MKRTGKTLHYLVRVLTTEGEVEQTTHQSRADAVEEAEFGAKDDWFLSVLLYRVALINGQQRVILERAYKTTRTH
jgi:lysozyme family protein